MTGVLNSGQWNMVYGRGLVHERLEAEFAEYLGVQNAVAVGTGGMALQMSIRGFGLRPGCEVIHQVDTCSATAMAVMNAGATPIFADVSEHTFMLSSSELERQASNDTRALIATHMWGNPEEMSELKTISRRNNWLLIEDGCLALGAIAQGKPVGQWGDAAVFSFGCLKPIQGGEGGMIATSDESFARELRSMRHWGDRTIDFGVRDAHILSWNGRMSEIVASVVREQLKGYPKYLENLRAVVQDFDVFLRSHCPGLEIVIGSAKKMSDCAFTQVVLRVTPESNVTKTVLWNILSSKGVSVWHANFELINSLTLFSSANWQEWILRGNLDRVRDNYGDTYPCATRILDTVGIGLQKSNFLTKGNYSFLKKIIYSAYHGKQF